MPEHSPSALSSHSAPSSAQVAATASEQTELQAYRQSVESLLALKSEQVISNGKTAHAAILFEVFFKKASQQVRIFCRNLNPEVFDNSRVVAEFKKATARNVFVDILVQEAPLSVDFLAHAVTSSNVRLRQAASEVVTKLNKNFAVMDAIAFRVEPNPETVEAKAVMYAPDQAKAWNSFFDLLIVS